MSRRVAIALSSVLLASCSGGVRSAPLECDPDATGGSEIVFGYQELDESDRSTTGRLVIGVNGIRYLFVDSACRFWAYRPSDDDRVLLWNPVRTGVLTSEEITELNAEVFGQPWGDLADGLAAATSAWYLGDVVTFCGEGCDSHALSDHRAVILGWVDALYDRGVEWAEGPLRVEVEPYDGPVEALQFAEWTGESDLATLVRPDGTGPTRGGRHVLEGADADMVRSLTGPYLRGERGYFPAALPLRDESRPFVMFVRQTIPLESSDGLIRPPG